MILNKENERLEILDLVHKRKLMKVFRGFLADNFAEEGLH